ncbi:MAG: beta-ketoacyl synthase N-terminal-like domain-containing protein, partial [Gemmataceae bacterium]
MNRGLRIIAPATGLAALERILSLASAQVAVIPADWDEFLRGFEAPAFLGHLAGKSSGPKPHRVSSQFGDLLARLRSSMPAERRTLLIAHVQGQVARVLGLAPGQLPDPQQGFFAQGMDSLMAVELRNRLQRDLMLDTLGATAIFDHPNVEALAAHLAEGLQLAEPARRSALPRPAAVDEPVAIVGLSCRFPGGENAEAFWQLLRAGAEGIREIPPDRWNVDDFYAADPAAPGKMYVRRGGFLEQIDRFDAAFFGIAPREAMSLDPQQRLLLEVAWEALENAGLSPGSLGGRTGVYIGISGSDFGSMLAQRGKETIDVYAGAGTSPATAAGRLSYVLGLQGPCVAIDTACSSSLVALSQACDALQAGRCEAALVGGVNAIVTPEAMIFECKAGMLSPEGRCKTFDAAADGYVRSEGCGVVVLKRASDARRDGDRILALIRGTAVNQDGRSSGLTVPNGPAQQAVVREALVAAGVEPFELSYVETHGTGTRLGDPIEVQALAVALGEGRLAGRPLLIGSVKTNIGHLEAAAGIAGLIKVVLSLQNEEIPRHLNFHNPNPHIPWQDLPVQVVSEAVPWPRGSSRRLAGLSSFGYSGTNAHVVLEEAPQPVVETQPVERPLHVLTLSAQTEPALRELCNRRLQHLSIAPEELADISYTANTGRVHFQERLALVASSTEQARQQLAASASGQEISGLYRGQRKTSVKQTWLFPGEGSHHTGMGTQLFETLPAFRHALLHCERLLGDALPRSLTELLFEDHGLLERAEYGSVAIFAFEYSLAQLWQSWNIVPEVLLGCGVGEYVAACIAGAFSLEDGLRLVVERGRLLETLPAGAMASVSTDADRTRAALGPFADCVDIAGLNGPTSTVISGTEEGVAAVLAMLEQQGIRSFRLPVSHALHSRQVERILDEFERVARTVGYQPLRLSLVSSWSGRVGDLIDAAYWRNHTAEPMHLASALQSLPVQSCDVFLEVGPQPVLCELVRTCQMKEDVALLASLQRGRADWEVLAGSLARLYVSGADVNWAAFDMDYRRRKVSMPTYPFQRQRYWVQESKTQRTGTTGAGLHPLLGPMLHSAARQDRIFETKLSQSDSLWLGEHRVYGEAILPGAAYLEAGLAAAREALGVVPVVEQAEFLQPLVLPAEGACTLQTVLTASAEGELSEWRVYSRDDTRDWVLHATGRIRQRAAYLPEAMTPQEVMQRCPEKVAVESVYAGFTDLGLDYGPSYRGLEELHRGDREAFGRIRVVEELANEFRHFHLHPALLDACFQVCGGVVSNAGDTAYLSFGVESLNFFGRPSETLWCWSRLRPDSLQTPTFDLQLWDEQSGQVIAIITGLSMRRAERLVPTDVARWFYEVGWEAQVREGEVAAADFLAGPQELSAQLTPRASA